MKTENICANYQCAKCGSTDTSLSYKPTMTHIKRTIKNQLPSAIDSYLNLNGVGSDIEIYKEFLLGRCNRCGAYFFDDTLDNKR